jgi:hypothetical protein
MMDLSRPMVITALFMRRVVTGITERSFLLERRIITDAIIKRDAIREIIPMKAKVHWIPAAEVVFCAVAVKRLSSVGIIPI